MTSFAAVAERVIDGDTVWVRVKIRTRTSSPPISTEDGKADADALKKRYPKGTRLMIEPITVDQFGRIVGTISRGF